MVVATIVFLGSRRILARGEVKHGASFWAFDREDKGE